MENMILHELFRVVSRCPRYIHFMLYRGKWISFGTVYSTLFHLQHLRYVSFPTPSHPSSNLSSCPYLFALLILLFTCFPPSAHPSSSSPLLLLSSSLSPASLSSIYFFTSSLPQPSSSILKDPSNSPFLLIHPSVICILHPPTQSQSSTSPSHSSFTIHYPTQNIYTSSISSISSFLSYNISPLYLRLSIC